MRVANCTQAVAIAEVDDDLSAKRKPSDAAGCSIHTRTPVRSLIGDQDLLLHPEISVRLQSAGFNPVCPWALPSEKCKWTLFSGRFRQKHRFQLLH
ncbi:hypothetical protein Psta_0987 [Pirellula staleyi DSM 6068]|uniref:Uncharacterized protein n=1 Tax=Pirellula staleyi (strain ATCC 27377 / DSM 6068 / ICPB 4128) TaxID=530564 RepID=D2R7H5_PIRSD|nr:hypothetical protein Psta_0987 [Pirellula staleyi DSM 6068]